MLPNIHDLLVPAFVNAIGMTPILLDSVSMVLLVSVFERYMRFIS